MNFHHTQKALQTCKRIMANNFYKNKVPQLSSPSSQQRTISGIARKKKTKVPSVARQKSQRFKDTINAKRIIEEESKESVSKHNVKASTIGTQTQYPQSQVSQSTDIKHASFWNAFLLIGVFPVIATGVLICFNEEMKDDFMNRFGNDIIDKLGIEKKES